MKIQMNNNRLFSELPTETTPDIDSVTISDIHDGFQPPFYRSIRPKSSSLYSYIGRWLLAATASTITIGYIDPRQELRRSGASSVFWSIQRKQGLYISLTEARRIALQILEDTDRRLDEERKAETQFLLSILEDEF
ncbi:MAG: hypothetical protein JW860_12815 [Sedimentisphaerales bacterium]|nr:hypothetical protein [Sedimentisphaerales bacterium]